MNFVSHYNDSGRYENSGPAKYTARSRKSSEYSMGFNPYPKAFPYRNGMVLHFYRQQESSMTKTVHKVINKGLKAYV